MRCEVCGRTASRTFSPSTGFPSVLLCTLCLFRDVLIPRLQQLGDEG